MKMMKHVTENAVLKQYMAITCNDTVIG